MFDRKKPKTKTVTSTRATVDHGHYCPMHLPGERSERQRRVTRNTFENVLREYRTEIKTPSKIRTGPVPGSTALYSGLGRSRLERHQTKVPGNKSRRDKHDTSLDEIDTCTSYTLSESTVRVLLYTVRYMPQPYAVLHNSPVPRTGASVARKRNECKRAYRLPLSVRLPPRRVCAQLFAYYRSGSRDDVAETCRETSENAR